MISIGFLFLANSLEILSPKPEVFLNTHPPRFPLLIDGFGVSRHTAQISSTNVTGGIGAAQGAWLFLLAWLLLP